MALSDPTRVVVEATIVAGATVFYGDVVKLVPEFAPVVAAVDDLKTYAFKWTAYITDSNPAQDDLESPTFGVVDAATYPTMALDGSGRTSAGDAGDTISVVIAGACLANVYYVSVNLTKGCWLYVGDSNVGAAPAGKLVTSVTQSAASNQISTFGDSFTNAAHYSDFHQTVRAKALVTTAVTAADAYVVAPVMLFNNPIGIAG